MIQSNITALFDNLNFFQTLLEGVWPENLLSTFYGTNWKYFFFYHYWTEPVLWCWVMFTVQTSVLPPAHDPLTLVDLLTVFTFSGLDSCRCSFLHFSAVSFFFSLSLFIFDKLCIYCLLILDLYEKKWLYYIYCISIHTEILRYCFCKSVSNSYTWPRSPGVFPVFFRCFPGVPEGTVCGTWLH